MKTPAAAAPGYQQSKWVIWIAVTVGISIVRLVVSVSDHSPRSTPLPASDRSPPAYQLPVYKGGQFYTPDGELIPAEKIGEATKRLLGALKTTDGPGGKSPTQPAAPDAGRPSRGRAPAVPSGRSP
jgi:hypothetical protein